MSRHILPLAGMDRLLRSAPDDLRISDPAKEELRAFLEEKGVQLAQKAAELAQHAGRKTIKAEDVKLAAKSMQ